MGLAGDARPDDLLAGIDQRATFDATGAAYVTTAVGDDVVTEKLAGQIIPGSPTGGGGSGVFGLPPHPAPCTMNPSTKAPSTGAPAHSAPAHPAPNHVRSKWNLMPCSANLVVH